MIAIALEHTFRHGVHPPESKELTRSLPIRRMPFPAEVVLPLRQHAGQPARVVVRKGQRVERGDVVAESDGFISVPIHASAAGVVKSIGLEPHPDGGMCEAVRITVDPYSAQIAHTRMVPNWEDLSRADVVKAVQQAGVVGLGGAAFPAHVKLVPPKDYAIELLIVNAAECEPYLTSDHRVMVEYADRVLKGTRIMMHALGVKRAVIGIEKNKPDAIELLSNALSAASLSAMKGQLPTGLLAGNGSALDIDVSVMPLTVKYPQGAEKMLIKALTGKEVPSGKLPASVGAVVQNVGTIACLAEVFETGLPLVERIVTVTGPGIRKPGNLIIPVGTPLRAVLDFCGGLTRDAAEILFGGPMMGIPQPDLDVPVVKGTSGIVVLTTAQLARRRTLPCIQCGRCLDACPVFLNPSQLGRLAQAARYEDMQAEHLADCMLCGSCSFVCPSSIPLAQMFALSKAALRRQVSK